MALSDLFLWIAWVGFFVMGVGALLAPTLVTRQFGFGDLTPAGKSEIRAVYGGFGLAMAAMLLVAAFAPNLRAGICLTLGMALLGMAGGRIVSASVDRTIGVAPLAYLTVEVVFGAGLLYAA